MNTKDFTTCKQVQEFINEENPKNYIFWGKPGIGKTHAMRFIVQELNKKYPANEWGYFKTLFVTVNTYLHDMWQNYKKFDGDPDETKKYFTRKYLLLDDLGTENLSQDGLEYLFMLISERNKPTIISTNLTPDELVDRYGERLMSRFVGNFIFVEFDGGDWRMQSLNNQKAEF